MKHPILLLSFKSMHSSRMRHILIALSYTIIFLFAVFETILIKSYFTSIAQRTLNTFGTQDCIIAVNSTSEVNDIKNDSSIKNRGTITSYGEFRIEGADNIIVGTYDENTIEINRLFAIEGHMPESPDEIAIERSWLLRNDIYLLGDTIEIINGLGESSRFVLCGVLRNYSEIEWGNANDTYQIPTAFISENALPPAPSELLFVSVVLENSANADHLTSTYDNVVLNQNNALAFSISKIYYRNTGYIYIIGIVTLVLTIILLYIIYSISTVSFSKKIGLLKIVGLSKRDVYLYFFVQHLCQTIPAAILGCISSIIISPLLITQLNTFVTCYYSWREVLIAIMAIFLVSIAILIIGLNKSYKSSIIDEIKNNAPKHDEDDAINVTTKNPYLLYSLKSIFLHNKQNSNLVIIIVISLIVLSAGFYITDYIANDIATQTTTDLVVQVYDTRFYEPIEINANIYAGLDENDFDVLSKFETVSEITGVKRLEVYSIENADSDNIYHGMFATEDEFEQSKAQYGYAGVNLSKRVIKGVGDDLLNVLEGYVVDGNIDLAKLHSGEEIIMIETNDNPAKKKVGDVMSFTKLIVNKAGDVEKMDFNATVGAVVSLIDIVNLSEIEQDVFSDGFVWASSAFDAIGIPLNYTQVYININDINNINDLNEFISQLQYKYSDCFFIVMQNLQSAEERNELCRAFKLISACTFAMLTVFSLFSIVMYVLTQLNSRKALLGILRSVGLTKRDLLLLFLSENLLLSTGAIGIGIVSGLIVCLLADISLGQFVFAFYPFWGIVIVTILYIAMVLVATVIPVYRFMKTKIAECFRAF